MPPRELESKVQLTQYTNPIIKPENTNQKERTNRALRQPAAETHQELQTIIIQTIKTKQDNEKDFLSTTARYRARD